MIEGWNKASKAKKDNLVAALLAILSGSPDEPVKDTTNNEPTKSEDKEEKGKADESGSRTAKRKRKTARPGCVLVTDCIKVKNYYYYYYYLILQLFQFNYICRFTMLFMTIQKQNQLLFQLVKQST